MYNQFGQNMGMGIPSVPTPQEMWKDEKTKYRPWIMLLVIGLGIIISLLVAVLVVNASNLTAIIDQAIIDYPDLTTQTIENNVRQMYIVYPSISIGLIVLGTIFYIRSLMTSYQKQSFAYLSTWGTFIVGFGALLSAYELIQLIWNPHTGYFSSTSGVLSFITNLMYIAIYIAISRKVTIIRRSFILAERMQLLKANPMFNQAAQAGNNPYGPTPASPAQPQANPTGAGIKDPSGDPMVVEAPINPELDKLQKMSVADLQKVAKKLSISGTYDMKKPELIEAIMKVTSGK